MLNNAIEKIKDILKRYYKTLIFFAIAGIVGGFFVGLYLLDSYPEEIQKQIYEQVINDVLLGVITAVQGAAYGIILGVLGILLGEKLGLFKNETTFMKKPLIVTAVVGTVGGLAMILFDILWFGRVSEVIMESYAVKPTAAFIIGAVIYGGVIEEVMLRLFMMSLLAFILHKIFGKGTEKPSVAVLVAANVVSSLLFATGHLPSTAILLGITPIILLRCFLLNGGIGILFGWLYHRYGLRYAMIAHAGCHVISKLVWILLI